MTEAVEETAAAFGHLDGLINNAGGTVARVTYADMTDHHYDAVMDLNARSVLAATTAAVPYLKQSGDGFIINTTSIAARNGASKGAGLYGSSKAFIANVTRGMAKELIAFDDQHGEQTPSAPALRRPRHRQPFSPPPIFLKS
jgi:3-oxoacyl-[acyl-carrier protein] reductase